MLKLFLSAFIIMLTHLLEGIAGFGGAVMALPFLNLTIGLKQSVYLLCLFGTVMSFYIILRSFREINWREFGIIALFSGIGMPIGLLLFTSFPAAQLCILLGLFMTVTGIHGSCRQIRPAPAAGLPPAKRCSIFMSFLLFCGGIFQGAFGCGGPCIVIYSAKSILQKSQFRATLSLLWLMMNFCRLSVWTIQGNFWNMQLLRNFAFILPFMLGGLLIGDYLHHKVNEKIFKTGIYLLLSVAGILMTVNNTLRLFQR